MPLSAPLGEHPFKREIISMVRAYDASRPRSMQKHLGPSEIGAPCARQLAYKLAGRLPVNDVADPWFPIVGTAVHAWLATALDWYQYNVLGFTPDDPRFLIENRVHADSEGGYSTSGSTDVYDLQYERVVDWKIVGVTTMRKVEKGQTPLEQVGEQYYVQGMTYGKGWMQRGLRPREVMIAFLPRSNYLSRMKLVTMPFDPAAADRAQERVGAIEAMVAAGIPPESFPAAGCTIWCPFIRPKVPLGTTSCPGHGEVLDE